MHLNALPLILSAAVLAACGGGGSDGGSSGFCNQSFAGAALIVDDSACPNCTVTGPNNTIDNSANSAMTVVFPSGGGQMRLRADASRVFDQNSAPGSLMLYPNGNFGQSGTQTQLYLGDQPVGGGNQTTTVGPPPGAGSQSYYAAVPTGDFDAIEVIFAINGNADPETVLFFETCGDG